MRYDSGQKGETRRRILHSAAARFRAGGVDSVRVIDVMQSVGMTQGGFYKHFADKDQLLSEAISTALEEVASGLLKRMEGLSQPEALRALIEFYLSEDHMTHPDLGCAMAALGTEMARMPPVMKAAVSQALDQYLEQLSPLMPGETPQQRDSAFLILFPSMAGCIMAARAHNSKERQQQILRAGRAFFIQAFCGPAAGASTGVMQ